MRGWQFTSPSLDLHDQIRGKKSGDDPDETVLLSQRDVREYNNCHQRTAGGILALAGKQNGNAGLTVRPRTTQ